MILRMMLHVMARRVRGAAVYAQSLQQSPSARLPFAQKHRYSKNAESSNRGFVNALSARYHNVVRLLSYVDCHQVQCPAEALRTQNRAHILQRDVVCEICSFQIADCADETTDVVRHRLRFDASLLQTRAAAHLSSRILTPSTPHLSPSPEKRVLRLACVESLCTRFSTSPKGEVIRSKRDEVPLPHLHIFRQNLLHAGVFEGDFEMVALDIHHDAVAEFLMEHTGAFAQGG